MKKRPGHSSGKELTGVGRRDAQNKPLAESLRYRLPTSVVARSYALVESFDDGKVWIRNLPAFFFSFTRGDIGSLPSILFHAHAKQPGKFLRICTQKKEAYKFMQRLLNLGLN